MPKTTKAKKNTTKEPKIEEKVEGEEMLDPLESDYGKILALWDFPEFIKYERSKLWYIGFAVIFLALLVYAYFSNNLLFAIILAIFAIIYLSSAKAEPVTIETAITEDGIFIGSKFIPYEDFRAFYIIYYPPEIKNLYLETRSIFKQRIVIPLENENPVYIRQILLKYLEEDTKKEEIPTSESISKILKL